MKKILLLLGAMALTFTLSIAEGKCSGNKCDSSKKTEKCSSGKCDSDKNTTKKVPAKGKCGQGKCG